MGRRSATIPAPAPTRSPSHDPSELISQHELELYLELSAKARAATSSQEALRKQILSKLGAGKACELGRLKALVLTSESKRLTFDALVEVLGFEEAEKLKARVPASTSTSLKVVEAA